MVSSRPVVILFKPAADLAPQIHAILGHLKIALANCLSIDDLPACLRLYPEHVPVLCIPLVLDGGRSGINETMQLKSNPAFRHFKILGLLTLYDKISLYSFYSSGAEVVMQPPFDGDLISLQIHALARNFAEQQASRTYVEHEREITRSTMRFLDTTRDGVVILDSAHQLISANRAAERILALDNTDITASFARLVPQIKAFLDHHTEAEREENSLGQLVSSADVTLTKSDGRAAPLLLRIMTLLRGNGTPFGYAVGIGDLSIPRQLATNLSNQERLRTTVLTLASGMLNLMGVPSLGIPGQPLKLVEQRLGQEHAGITLSRVITPLLEMIDLILPPEAEIRVNIKEDCEVIATPSEVFRLAGSLLFYTVDQAGAGGEIGVESTISDDRSQVSLLFTYVAHELVEPISGDYFMALIQGDHSRFISRQNESIHALKFAEQFASRIGVTVEATLKSRWKGKIRVILPCNPITA